LRVKSIKPFAATAVQWTGLNYQEISALLEYAPIEKKNGDLLLPTEMCDDFPMELRKTEWLVIYDWLDRIDTFTDEGFWLFFEEDV